MAEVIHREELGGVQHATVEIAGECLLVTYDLSRRDLSDWHPRAPNGEVEWSVLVHSRALLIDRGKSAHLSEPERDTIEAALLEDLNRG